MVFGHGPQHAGTSHLKNGNPMKTVCHICHNDTLEMVSLFHELKQVTSDCRPHPRNGHLGICTHCGSVQKRVDAAYRAECDEIYRSYALYRQSGGVEQKVFSQACGTGDSRSMVMFKALEKEGVIPQNGHLLDVGCGNGSLLRSFHSIRPDWTMWGCELHDANKSEVEAIPGVEGFHVGDVAKLDRQFEMVSMQHSLEHFFEPVTFLSSLRNKLTPGGLLLIEVPNYAANPFDLVVADHVTHFDKTSLERVIEAAGYDIVFSSDEAIPKELTLLARRADREMAPMVKAGAPEAMVREYLSWLLDIRDQAHGLASKGSLGLFGTAIAAVWLLSELGDEVSFFVDEDATRVGKNMFGIPVHAPNATPTGTILLPFPMAIAEGIARRLEHLDIRLALPRPVR